MGRADDANINGFFLVRAHRAHTALLYGTQQFGLHGQRQIANLIQEQGAPFCGLEEAFAVLHRAGIGTFLGAKELGLEQVLGNGAAIHGDPWTCATVAGGVQSAGYQLLAGARLSSDQYGGHAARNFDDAVLDTAHDSRFASQLGQCPQTVAIGIGRFQLRGVRGPPGGTGFWRNTLHSGRDSRTKLLQINRFGQVIKSARLQRLHRIFRRAMGCDDNAALGAVLRLHVAQDLGAQAIGQPHVGDHHVKALCVQQLQGLLHAARRVDPVAFPQ